MASTPLDFGEIVRDLQSIGFYEYVLPFLLVFAIIFAALEKTQLFGSGKTNINVIVALIFGFLLVAQQGVVKTINEFLPNVSLILIVVLAGLLVISMLAGEEYQGLSKGLMGIGVIAVIIAFVIALWPEQITFLDSYDKERLLYTGIIVLAFIGVIWLIAGGKKDSSNTSGGSKIYRALETLGEGVKRRGPKGDKE